MYKEEQRIVYDEAQFLALIEAVKRDPDLVLTSFGYLPQYGPCEPFAEVTWVVLSESQPDNIEPMAPLYELTDQQDAVSGAARADLSDLDLEHVVDAHLEVDHLARAEACTHGRLNVDELCERRRRRGRRV